METIKEIAVACGVSEQSIRAWCKKNNVAKERNGKSMASYIIDETTKAAIISHYSKYYNEQEPQVRKESTKDRKESAKENPELVMLLKSENHAKDEQLAAKDKQIEALNQQIESKDKQLAAKDEQLAALTNALASAQEAQTRLTESLAAEQALHAGTIQKQLTMQDEKPVGFWGRLFGKKKKGGEDSHS